MKTEIKKLQNSIVEITIEETPENLLKHRRRVLENLRKNANINGFRKGAKIPDEIIIKNFGEPHIFNLTIDEALNSLYGQALRENGIMPVSQGEINEIVSQNPLVIKMHVEVFPSVEIKDTYKTIKVKKTNISLSDDEVSQALDQIQTKFSKFKTADNSYKAKMGDKVYISTAGFDLDGNALENTNMENYPIVLGSNFLVKGFEEGLVGKSIGEKIELDIEFPKDYHVDTFAGKKTKFKVDIINIEECVKPEFTKEFIKDLRGKDLDLDGFKNLIKQELLETKETNARIQDEGKLVDELLKITSLEVGENLLKNQIEKVYAEIKENISSSGAKVADYIASLGLTEEQYKEVNVKPIALKRLQAELILHKLLEIEKIEAKKEQIEEEIQKILERFGSQEVVARLKELYIPGTKYYEELQQRIAYRNLIDTFFE